VARRRKAAELPHFRAQDFPPHIAAMARASGQARISHAVRAWGPARQVVRLLEPGGEVFAVSAAQFGAIDLVAALLEKCGPAKVDVWSYVPGDAELEALLAFCRRNDVTELRLVLDVAGMHVRAAGAYGKALERFGDSLRVTANHAKFVTLAAADWRVVVSGSANMAKNLRFEHFTVRDSRRVWTVCRRLTDEVFSRYPAPDLAALTKAAAQAQVREVSGVPKLKRQQGKRHGGGAAFGDWLG